MKKLIYILISLVAFSVGVAVFYIRPQFIPISLGELRENISQYKFVKVRVKGNFEVTKAESTYFFGLQDYKNKCSGGSFCYVGLELSKETEEINSLLINELPDKNQTLGKTDYRRGVYLAEIEVNGYLEEEKEEKYKDTGISGGVGPAYIIKVQNIKQISPIKFVTNEELSGVK